MAVTGQLDGEVRANAAGVLAATSGGATERAATPRGGARPQKQTGLAGRRRQHQGRDEE